MRDILSKLRLHGQTVPAFPADGVAGVFVHQFAGPLLAVGCAAVLLLLAAPAILRDYAQPA